MDKNPQQRILDTLNCISRLFPQPQDGARIRAVLEKWLNTQNVNELSGRLSLRQGNRFSDDTARELRHARRALLMVYERYQVPASRTAAVRTMGLDTIREKLLEYFPRKDLFNSGMPRETSLASSFVYAREEHRNWAMLAGAEVIPRVTAALLGLSHVRTNRVERARFEKWFGKFTDAKYRIVLENLQKICRSPKGYRLYYRGQDLDGKIAMEGVPPYESSLVAIQSVPDAGFYSRDSRRDNDEKYCHIFLGKAFWGSQVKVNGQEGVAVSRCAVLVHELTHYLCGTVDFTYGSENCKQRAAEGRIEVINNASSYQWYIDEF